MEELTPGNKEDLKGLKSKLMLVITGKLIIWVRKYK
jgi:hypothetical protein